MYGLPAILPMVAGSQKHGRTAYEHRNWGQMFITITCIEERTYFPAIGSQNKVVTGGFDNTLIENTTKRAQPQQHIESYQITPSADHGL